MTIMTDNKALKNLQGTDDIPGTQDSRARRENPIPGLVAQSRNLEASV